MKGYFCVIHRKERKKNQNKVGGKKPQIATNNTLRGQEM